MLENCNDEKFVKVFSQSNGIVENNSINTLKHDG